VSKGYIKYLWSSSLCKFFTCPSITLKLSFPLKFYMSFITSLIKRFHRISKLFSIPQNPVIDSGPLNLYSMVIDCIECTEWRRIQIAVNRHREVT
jgi:hypothetical protein